MITWQAIPCVRMLIPLLFGIGIAPFCKVGTALFYIGLAVLFLGLAAFFIWSLRGVKYQLRTVFGMVLSIWWMLFGVWVFECRDPMRSPHHFGRLLADTSASLLVTIVDVQPSSTGKTNKILLEVEAILTRGNQWQPASGKLLCYQRIGASYFPGTYYLLRTSVERIPAPAHSWDFDYARFMALQGVLFQTVWEDGVLLQLPVPPKPTLQAVLIRLRATAGAIFKERLSSESAGVASALVLGDKGDLLPETRKQYSRVGAMHVLAVSGLHVGILAIGVSWLLGFLPVAGMQKRWIISVGTLLIIWIFAILTGGSASVLRSAVMFSLFLTGKQLNRRGSFWNIFFGSALLVLCVDPRMLFSVGFQLSYLAVGGIVLLQPILYRQLLLSNTFLDYCWKLISVSFAAQIATAPLSIFYFHQFPWFFWLSGLIVVPLAGVVLCLGISLLAVDPLPFLSVFVETILEGVLQCMNWSMALIADIPFAFSGDLIMGLPVLVLILLFGMGLILWRFYSGRGIALILLGLASVIISLQLATSYRSNQQTLLAVFSHYSGPVLQLVSGQKGYILADDPELILQTNYSRAQFNLQFSIKQTDTLVLAKASTVLKFRDRSLLIQNGEQPPPRQLAVDYLVLLQEVPVERMWDQVQFRPKMVLLSHRLTPDCLRIWQRYLEDRQIKYQTLHADSGMLEHV